MRLIWTRSDILSDEHDIVTWAYGHRCSHFAIAFFNETVFFHSHWDGVGVDDYYDFYASRIKVYEIEYDIGYEEQSEILQAMIDLHGMLGYDYRFLAWLVWNGAKIKVLGMDPAKRIESEDPDLIICHEAVQLLPDDIRPDIDWSQAVMPEDTYRLIVEASDGV